LEKTNCTRCGTAIDAEDHFCRVCGVQLRPLCGGEFAPVQIVAERKPAPPSYSDNRLIVLIMLFLVLGPFALPMLWKSKAFTRPWKWIWTLVVISFTVFLCWLVWFIAIKMILEPLQHLRF
jgi:hypothetical protein